jgi:hypothetical protein
VALKWCAYLPVAHVSFLSGLRIQSFVKDPDRAFSLQLWTGFHDSVIFAFYFSSLKSLFYCREKTRPFLKKIKLPFFIIHYIISSVPDPCILWHFGTDPDSAPNPALFVSYLQDTNTKKAFLSLYAYSFLKVHLHYSLKIKSDKTVPVEIKVFFIICLLMEGSGSARSVQINFGSRSGSRRPNLRITCT